MASNMVEVLRNRYEESARFQYWCSIFVVQGKQKKSNTTTQGGGL